MARKMKTNYFNLLLEQVGDSNKAAEYLKDQITNFETRDLLQSLEELHAIEHGGDKKKHNIMKLLAKEFVTPLEIEDLIALTQTIDDVTDAIEDILQKFYIFRIENIRKETIEFMEIILESTQRLGTIFQEFEHFKKSKTIGISIIEVNNLEEEADALYARAVRRLYAEENIDAKTLNAWTAIFNQFEKCCDTCEHLANLVEEVVMNNI